MKLNENARFYVSDTGWVDFDEIAILDSIEDAVASLWSSRETERTFLYICLEDESGKYYDEATLGRIVIDQNDNIWWFNMAPNVNYAYKVERPEEILNLLKKNEIFCEYLVL